MRRRERGVESLSDQKGVTFGPFRLTLDPLCLWRGRKLLPLQPRPLAVLHYFVEHPETVVSNDTLRQAVWGLTIVSPTTVQVCVREVRKALRDNGSSPRYIETVGREGYRFIGQVVSSQYPVVSREGTEGKSQRPETRSPSFHTQHSALSTLHSVLVGREAELARLYACLEKALQGERQLVFITGEAGIGKTTVVDAFLAQLGARGWGLGAGPSSSPKLPNLAPSTQHPTPSPWLGRGQCLEHYGEGEPYLPVLEAVGQLCQSSEGIVFLTALRRYAPTWLLHLPGLIEPEEGEALQRRVAGATQNQMLREMAEALEAVSQDRGVILVFEDLHASDPSTVELLAYLAQRRSSARLLLLGTYRPVEIAISDHPLRERVHELVARGYGQRLSLELLTEAEVAVYLHQRLGSSTPPATLASQIYQRTDGNALFVVSTVEYLLQQQRLTHEEGQWRMAGNVLVTDVPDSLHQLLLAQFDNFPLEQRQVLEVASVVGTTFTAASVTAGLQTNLDAVEAVCEELARGQFIEDCGLATWPDGTVSGHYGFRHALYQEVLYQRLGTGRRVRLHLAIGSREEAGYGTHASEHATELARHFAEGHNVARALHYIVQAGRNALARAAHVEAFQTFTHGLALLTAQPDIAEWRQQELWLQIGLGVTLMATKGFTAPEVEQAFQRAQTLCRQLGESPELLPVLTGLWTFSFTRGDLRTARALAEQTLRMTREGAAPPLLGVAQANMQATVYFQGELTAARGHGERTLALNDAVRFPLEEFGYSFDLEVRTRSNTALVLLVLGYTAQALQQIRTAFTRARELGHIQTTASTLQFLASVHSGRREWREMETHSITLVTFATTHSLPFWWAQGTVNYGLATAQQGQLEEGLNHIQQGLAVYRMTGAMLGVTRVLGWLAEIYGQTGQLEQGLATLDEALRIVECNDERIWEAELYRRKGELLLAQESQKSKSKSQKAKIETNPQLLTPNPQAGREAEACFRKAIEIARRQQAKLWELRAVMSLVRLRQQEVAWSGSRTTHHETHARLDAARTMLSDIYTWFTEGFDTQDLQEAKALLDSLGARVSH